MSLVKDKILQAAQKLIVDGATASRINAATLADAGACSAAEFKDYFSDLPAFQRELCTLLFASAREAVIAATTGLSSGLEQMRTAFISYLDYNLQHPALQELAHHIQYQPPGWELLQRMELGVAMVVQADLEAMNASLRAARAQLLTAMVVSIVRAEFQAGKKLPGLREVLVDYCRLSAGQTPAVAES